MWASELMNQAVMDQKHAQQYADDKSAKRISRHCP